MASINVSTATAQTPSVCIPFRRGGDATVSSVLPDHIHAKYQLPTPPTSISPSLPPTVRNLKADGGDADHLGTADTDMDVSDVGDSGVSKDHVQAKKDTPSLHLVAEAAGAITPTLLAKHHLPGILLQHGPLAIRHVTAYLISSIPGFSSIPPAKQRRLVVGALEGRGGSSGIEGEAGGVNGDVIFEKVGWGRWDARKKGDPPRDQRQTLVASPAIYRSNGLLSGIPNGAPGMKHSSSYTGESGIFVQSEEEDISSDDSNRDHDHKVVTEEEADQMSLDETSSEDEDADMTDEEDWEQMGAAMLRRQGTSPITSCGWSSNNIAKSPPRVSGQSNSLSSWEPTSELFATLRAKEEQEAVEALVKLSSV